MSSKPLVRWKAICGNTLKHTLNSFKPHEAFNAILKNERPNIINESNASELFPLSLNSDYRRGEDCFFCMDAVDRGGEA